MTEQPYLSEDPVALALRFADLGGSSTMARTLAAEVRRLRGLFIKSAEQEERVLQLAARCLPGGVTPANLQEAADILVKAFDERPAKPVTRLSAETMRIAGLSAEDVREYAGTRMKIGRASAENVRARTGQCACTWHDTGDVHAADCPKYKGDGVALQATTHPSGPAVAEDADVSPESLETVEIELPPLEERDVRHALATVEQFLEYGFTTELRLCADLRPALALLLRAGKEWLRQADHIGELVTMQAVVYKALNGPDLPAEQAMQDYILKEIEALRTLVVQEREIKEAAHQAISSVEIEVRKWEDEASELLKSAGKYARQVREGGGVENLRASLALTMHAVIRLLQEHNARVNAAMSELRNAAEVVKDALHPEVHHITVQDLKEHDDDAQAQLDNEDAEDGERF